MASFNETSKSPSASTVNVQNPLSQSNNLPPLVTTPSFSFSSMNQPLIVKLDNGNYLIWKNQLLNVIIANELDDFIGGSRSCPPQFLDLQQQIINLEYLVWQRYNRLLMSWLYAFLFEDIMAQIVGYSTTVEIWNALNQIYCLFYGVGYQASNT
ncbi:hypothetical protein CK203_023575 [Vitis vinifera]|uniref:Retrotransposon Copia-like N-terminal domain-containing protein n=1 Tax=Vitis vinifera TaxID=29760 RepID=A0A438JBM8_VITVI|nr:hypothetical protein CK203_023575 [Vitis vinifera]